MTNLTDIRVYYEDTDAGGIVYYANYLKFCERGRTELLRIMGFDNKSLWDRSGVGFVVRSLSADDHKPAYLDDLLTVRTEIGATGPASVEMKQSVRRQDILLFEMDVLLACIDRNNKPVRLPAAVSQAFKEPMNE